ncbi:MAG: hypothetical protein ACE14T_09625 [Syntrophales bacterium]
MKTCTRCLLPGNFPSVRYDSNGVCNYCRFYQDFERRKDEGQSVYLEKMEKLIERHRNRGDYDILMAYSGGKDSTYALDLFKNRFHLRVLALTFDHGFVSSRAMRNITTVIERLGIDHITFKPSFEMLKRIFVLSIQRNIFTTKTIERASTICTSCMNFVKLITIKTALEKRIPFLGFGWSPGQAPIQSSVMKNNPGFIRSMQKAIFDPLFEAMGEDISPYFLTERHFDEESFFPYNLHPLAFMKYDEEAIYRRIRQLGWIPPDDTDPNSTNCLMNAFANRVHLEKYGFHPYVFEISGHIRMGIITREEGLRRLNEPENDQIIEYIKNKLGI